jgi:hypothetical protein
MSRRVMILHDGFIHCFYCQTKDDKGMKFSSAVSVKFPVSDAYEAELNELIFNEFNRISDCCTNTGNGIRCDSINASFGSILRKDSTIVSIQVRKQADGYNIIANTEYKPSGFFWVFFIIDILLIETIIGFVFGMGVTLGLYFYNKKLVVSEIENALKNIKNQTE